MLRISILILVLLCAEGWAAKLQCREAVPDFQIKQRQINHLADKINKPIYKVFKTSEGWIEETVLDHLGHLPIHQPFSLFDERHHEEVSQVIDVLLKAKDFNTFLNLAEVIHQRVNEDLFLYCLSVVLLHRNDTQGLHVPPVHKIFPDKFIPINVIQKMKKLAQKSDYLSERPIVDAAEDTVNHMDPIHDVGYFLEDVGMNVYHYLWHVLYPSIWTKDDLDRKGESFAWMHKQMVSSYEAERLSNGLGPIYPYENWDEPIKDGYASHLGIDKLDFRYAYRPPNVVLKNLKDLSKTKMVRWFDRLMRVAQSGYVLAKNGTYIKLNETHGIEILGDLVESSLTSINKKFYGNLHSYAHVMAGKITDPQNTFSYDSYGPMYDVATSARDPLFYTWHALIDKIFQSYKKTLPPYTTDELDFPGVKVNQVTIKAYNTTTDNLVHTYWQESTYKVPKGFKFTGKTSMKVKVKHLQHENFLYEMDVENTGPPKVAIVRQYLIPAYHLYGYSKSLNYKFNRVIEMDKFTVKLTTGKNIIKRPSTESNVVTPWSHIFEDYYKSEPMDHCHCGRPDYLLLPKGTYKGMKFAIATVINDWDEEKVDQPENCHCPDSVNYCGDADRYFPYKRALGYPFDRKTKAFDFQDFKTPNMYLTEFIIQFTGEVRSDKLFIQKQYH